MRKLIKRIDFTGRARKLLTFSDPTKIRLNDDVKTDPGLALKDNSGFDLGLDNWVLTPIFTLRAAKKWLGFDADEVTPAGTTISYRILRGVDELWWNGSAWSPATTTAHWNSMSQVNTNLQALVLTGFDIRIKVNLRTADVSLSPKVRSIKLLVQVDFDSWDDLIYDTVIRSLKTNLRATTALQFEVVTQAQIIDLAVSYKLENSGYNFTGVRAAYNLTLDPNQLKNIAQSYTLGPAKQDGSFEDGQVTLTELTLAGHVLRIEMEYEPEIAVFTSQDYYEVARVPAIVFESIQSTKVLDGHDQELNDGEGDYVRNLITGTAVEVPRPRQSTVRFQFAIHASPLDVARLGTAMDEWMSKTRLLKTWGFEDELNLDPVSEIDTSDRTNIEDVVMATGAFQLRGVPFYVRDSKDVNLITNINLNLIP